MYKLENIKEVHLEMTEVCQAACPMCPRVNYKGILNPNLKLSELTLDDCKKIFPPEFVKQLRNIFMCGTFGDAAAAKDTLNVFRYFRECSKTIWLTMFTNGGLRNKEWWEELASILGENGDVIFSVDGLRDTNHIYRQNVIWNNVENNMRTFIGAGGRARWDFLVFEHNEHQIDEAKRFSEELGFKKITFKKSARFSPSLDYTRQNVEVVNRKGERILINKPSENYQNSAEKDLNVVKEKYKTVENYNKTVPIKCKAVQSSSIYISAEGLFLPCCWWHGPMYSNNENEKKTEIWKLIESIGGKEKLDARQGLDKIFNSGILDIIKNSWEINAAGRLNVCSETCGIDYDPRAVERL